MNLTDQMTLRLVIIASRRSRKDMSAQTENKDAHYMLIPVFGAI
jgi:hypothetical protein